MFCHKELIFMLFFGGAVLILIGSFIFIYFISSEVFHILFEECDWYLKEEYDIWRSVTVDE